MYFDRLIFRKEVLFESSHLIETHLDVVVEFLEIQSSFSFELCLDEEFIDFWQADIKFHSSYATNFSRLSAVHW